MDALNVLLTRRSVKAALLRDPAPTKDELTQILTIATRVPDHGKLAPWRIKLLDKKAQIAFGERISARFAALNPDATPQQIDAEAQKIRRAPLLMVVIYAPTLGRIPEWEQQLSCGAVCMNILHAAHALGYGANWLTEWPAFDSEVKAALGGGADDRIAGFIYVGSYSEKPEDRPRPDLAEVVSEWGG